MDWMYANLLRPPAQAVGALAGLQRFSATPSKAGLRGAVERMGPRARRRAACWRPTGAARELPRAVWRSNQISGRHARWVGQAATVGARWRARSVRESLRVDRADAAMVSRRRSGRLYLPGHE